VLVQPFQTEVIYNPNRPTATGFEALGDALAFKITDELHRKPGEYLLLVADEEEDAKMPIPAEASSQLRLLASILQTLRPQPRTYHATGAYFKHKDKWGASVRLIDAKQQTIVRREVVVGTQVIKPDEHALYLDKLAEMIASWLYTTIAEIGEKECPRDPAYPLTLAAIWAEAREWDLAEQALDRAEERGMRCGYSAEISANRALIDAVRSGTRLPDAARTQSTKDEVYYAHFRTLPKIRQTMITVPAKGEERPEQKKPLQDVEFGEWQDVEFEDQPWGDGEGWSSIDWAEGEEESDTSQ
jgi:hypothetical protein